MFAARRPPARENQPLARDVELLFETLLRDVIEWLDDVVGDVVLYELHDEQDREELLRAPIRTE